MKRFRNWFRERYPKAYSILRLPRVWYRPTAKDLLHRELKKCLDWRRDLFFVQVGSNDGLHNDPIRPFVLKHKEWRGIFVEPVRSLFERLVKNYGAASRFIFENVAIGHETGSCQFHYVSEDARSLPDVPGWFDQLGSFDREHILKHCDGRLAPYIVTATVETLTLQDLLERHGVERLDLLHVDTEGHDFRVLSSVDFLRHHPDLILYEHLHLSPPEKEMATTLLLQNGYVTREYGGDTLAFSNTFDVRGK